MSRATIPSPSQRAISTSKTGRVWEIADALSEKLGRRADRRSVIDAYVAEGGNPNTGSTQYAYWKRAFEERHSDRQEGFASVPTMRLTIGKDGRLVIPAEMRAAMLLGDDEPVSAEVVDGELRILSLKGAVSHVQAMARRFDRGTGSPVDELIAERREEARREDESHSR
ncbi:hypothetical protein [Jiella sonneratiae]|uniref:SpoVT-AbrB domain-containing protein n=1 Tax=Jiella sonneratiae TaxID=2816856 RepID=A0ABS3J9J8_9HYPH|nr:hypothetical protein [Jiella sonneratiae]MBO0906360.1 hypothetical protein [Jiella sonneratiae]